MSEQLTFKEFARRYCERQQQTPEGLKDILLRQKHTFKPDGWMLLECAVMDSSRLGSYTILPFGGMSTYAQCPTEGLPISPRGLASDISFVVATLASNEI